MLSKRMRVIVYNSMFQTPKISNSTITVLLTGVHSFNRLETRDNDWGKVVEGGTSH